LTSILIVEDSGSTAHLEAHYLKEAGYTCRIARYGIQALDMYREERPDLVVVDYLLPDINGLDVLTRVLEIDPTALVVMVTGAGFEELAAGVMKAGAKDYVVKSDKFFRPLVLTVTRVLQEAEERAILMEKLRYSQRLEDQRELVYWMAHNFKNILSGAVGFLELIDFGNERQEVGKRREYLGEAGTSLARAVQLMDQLLNLTSNRTSDPERVDLKEVIHKALDMARCRLNPAMPPTFDFTYQGEAIDDVFLCPRDASLVFESILLNAIESLVEPGHIRVEARIENDRLLITIADTGCGMDEKTLKRSVDPLFSTKGTVGVGLGLSLAQAALNRHGGDMRITSEPGQGTTVILGWPVPASQG
jgi:signal transduction histidine kinase